MNKAAEGKQANICLFCLAPGALPCPLPPPPSTVFSRLPAAVNQSNWNFTYASAPDLWMLVYDGNAMDAATAYTTGNGEHTLVYVDSTTTVTMDPVYMRYRNRSATYQYHITLNRSPNVDSTCDVSGKIKSPLDKYYSCSGLFLFRVQNFQSSVLYERRRLEWGDFGASVGAYFALIQAISWLLSALAFQRT